jgi:hypothetical protein
MSNQIKKIKFQISDEETKITFNPMVLRNVLCDILYLKGYTW